MASVVDKFGPQSARSPFDGQPRQLDFGMIVSGTVSSGSPGDASVSDGGISRRGAAATRQLTQVCDEEQAQEGEQDQDESEWVDEQVEGEGAQEEAGEGEEKESEDEGEDDEDEEGGYDHAEGEEEEGEEEEEMYEQLPPGLSPAQCWRLPRVGGRPTQAASALRDSWANLTDSQLRDRTEAEQVIPPSPPSQPEGSEVGAEQQQAQDGTTKGELVWPSGPPLCVRP